MAELVYAFDLKSNGEIHMGSSPISGTSLLKLRSLSDFLFKVILMLQVIPATSHRNNFSELFQNCLDYKKFKKPLNLKSNSSII